MAILKFSTGIRCCCLAMSLLLLSTIAAAQPASREKTEGPKYDSYTLLFFESQHPYFIRLQVAIDSQPPEQMRAGLLGNLFEQTDTNRNGEIDLEELRQFRGPARMQDVVKSQAESNDAPITRETFVAILEPALGIPFGLQLESARVSDLPDLFSKLDLNEDHILEADEWESALHLLEKYDFDDDETLNLVEVMPLLRPLNLTVARSQPTPAGHSAGLFELIDPQQPREQLAQQLLAQYDGARGQKEDGQLDQTELGWTADDWMKKFDANEDQALNRTELLRVLTDPPAQRIWRMRMPLQERITVRFWEADTEDEDWKYPRSSSSRAQLSVGGWELGVRIHNPRPQFADVLSFYKLRFLQADTDSDGGLTKEEARGLNVLAPFAYLDEDQDEKLTREELTKYVNQEASLAQCQLLMSVDKKSQSLFRLLDVDSDRRLEPRELLHPAEKMKSFDNNHDGQLTEPEMKTIYELSFQLQPPSLFMDSFNLNNANRIGPILTPPTTGPEWFRQMDRNLDGDLTRREFLGPGVLFQKFDLDQDRLLSPKEAEQVSGDK
ncbi:transaldolase/EF-hand domain-containing protein [Polystyrenella longa]|uniref:Transaldolase/EF-hand domain-containing protein n=1 Tax=Polystyrenella longa TaxID=2528007 RepID=A0A518CHU1_9PLAN|nr:hypothetical protein [Polystyrenella longa]QDU78795.1 transaldolase/EF-hand domain-containing protein [Polystyrenella longa]